MHSRYNHLTSSHKVYEEFELTFIKSSTCHSSDVLLLLPLAAFESERIAGAGEVEIVLFGW